MKPFCIQVELVEGCPLRCTFCGINGIPTGYQLMTTTTAERVAQLIQAVGWSSRIEFAMHGEPTYHPQVVDLVRLFRQRLPKAYLLMETNGFGLVRDPQMVPQLFNAGLNTLAVDEYQQVDWASRLRTIHPGLEYPSQGPSANPHRRKVRPRLIYVEPIDTARTGTHNQINNHCGAGGPLEPLPERCAKPFRELSVRWNGWVAVCCNDWRGTLPIGHVRQLTLTEIWDHPRMQAIRRYLYHARREVGPCVGCNAKSYRVGLLPDKYGQQTLPEPTAEDLKTLTVALGDGPLTEPVLRPWEL